MKILADENIPFVRELFGHLGDVHTFPGRHISPEIIKNADILLVRSVTKVNADLLTGSAVRFVATATIGTDHVDESFLQREGIGFANAAGSNANSVAEYVFAALLEIALARGWSLAGKSLGVVGVGHIGSLVAQRAKAIGMTVLENDPPLQRETGDSRFVSLEAALEADIVTFHVPLTFEGPDKTVHLLNEENLRKLAPDTCVVNASRGPVVDNVALKNRLQNKKLKTVVLDVWEHEPTIDTDLLARVFLGTPHIAGYSLDGKANGTQMIYNAVCHFLNVPPQKKVSEFLPPPPVPEIVWPPSAESDEIQIRQIVRKIYDIRADDARLRRLEDVPKQEQGGYFDHLRKTYPVRREFGNTRVILPESGQTGRLAHKLRVLGFQTEETNTKP